MKIFEKNNLTVALNILYATNEKSILPMIQNLTQSMKKLLF